MPERELKRVALLHGLGSVTPEQIAAELPRQGVITAEIDGRLMATTDGAASARSDSSPASRRAVAARSRRSACPTGLDRTLADGKALNDGQWETVTGLLDFGKPRQSV